jgi:hypothetical protein
LLALLGPHPILHVSRIRVNLRAVSKNWRHYNMQKTIPRNNHFTLKQNTQLDATINHKFYSFVIQTLLNMFRALQCPSSGARQTAVAASGFHMNVEVGVFSAVVG